MDNYRIGYSYRDTTFLSTYCADMEYKGLKKWLGIAVGAVAAIAAPFLAPVIAGAIGASGFLATTVIGAGIGAIGGAAGSAIGGGNILQGALYGGLGGGLATGAGQLLGAVGGTAAGAGGTAAGAGPTALPGLASQTAGVGAAAGAGGLSSALGGSFGTLTNSLLQAAPGMAAQLFSNMSQPDQQKYLDQLKAELEQGAAMNRGEYETKLNLFNELVNEYKNIDPTYAAQLAQATIMQRAAAIADEESRNAGLKGGASYQQNRDSNQRMAAIEATKQASAAYAGAFNDAQGSRLAGLSQMSPPSYNNANTVAGLQNLYTLQSGENDKFGEDIGAMIRPFTYAFAGQQPQKASNPYA